MSAPRIDLPEDRAEIILFRHYKAPRRLVWAGFTEPEHLVHWWGPEGFTIEHDSADIRTGGYWKFVMVGPDGTRWDNYHQFTAVDPMDLIAHRHGSKRDDPDAFEAEVRMRDADGGTDVTMSMRFPSMESRAGVLAYGADRLGQQTLGKLETYLQKGGLR